MNLLDFIVLFGSMLGIGIYGMWRTRGQRDLSGYLRGDRSMGWTAIGLSVMATQASAITFISTPGQGFESGLGFVQNYFGLPLALVFIAVVFLPMYRRLDVYTAYEFLGHRFDRKTRLLGAVLFLLQRGLAAGITIYAPAIILSTVLAWRVDMTIVACGLLVIAYTVSGGSDAVTLTQKYQMGVIFGGMVTAFGVMVYQLPAELPFSDVLAVAGTLEKLEAVSFSLDVNQRYTIWSGLLGGFFLSLSYFGTDQSQVQRYISCSSLRESRLGLMFNAALKIPMQFCILFLGVVLFVFYQFEQPPVFFNRTAWEFHRKGASGETLRSIEQRFGEVHVERRRHMRTWLAARRAGDTAARLEARDLMLAAHQRTQTVRAQAKEALSATDPRARTNDSDYVFITFILDYLPHGLIGLLVAAFIAATLSSNAAELNALGATTTVDLYKHVVHPDASDEHYVKASRGFTLLWGLVALAFALFANTAENLIQAINIVGSLFYGVVLAMFLVAFFLKRIEGTAIFWAALAAQTLVLVLYSVLSISYLWYNLIGCVACVAASMILQALMGRRGPGRSSVMSA